MKELLPDTTLSHYRIVEKIGAGGMGEVYLAQDTSELGRIVALKILPAEVAGDKDRLQRFIQEARTVSNLNHPNILTVHEFGQTETASFMATEYVDGVSLRQHLSNRRLKLVDVLDVAIQIVAALNAAHEAGVTHRDLKPDNVMVRRDHIVKVLDFGLAKPSAPPSDKQINSEAGTKVLVHTEPGLVMGTVSYMSPEQSIGKGVDQRTDIWSVGVVLYEMIAGCLPFAGKDIHRQIIAIQEAEPAPLSQQVEGVPERLEEIVAKCLAKEKDERYQTAKDLLIDLRNLRRKLDVDAEIERIVAPQFRTTSGSASRGSTQPTQTDAGATSAAPVQPTSSAEYVVTEIRQHKLAAGLAVLTVIGGLIGLGLYLRAGKSEAAIKSIAVMPFVNASGNADVEYLSDGMTETLIGSLSQLPNLSVKARSSVFRYKGKETNPQTVGKELSVQAILNGRVVQHGDQLLLSLELIDPQTENVIWSEQYNRRQADLVTLQSEIARDVSSKLKTKLSGADETKVAKTHTANAEAYQLYLKGRFYFDKRTKEDLLRSIQSYERAISLDPNFALAYVGVADSYGVMSGYGYAAPNDVIPKSKAAARRALQLDPDLAEAHAAYARSAAVYDWNWSEAEREFKRSIELNPNVASTHYMYGLACLAPLGRFDEATNELRQALELEPLSVPVMGNLVLMYVYARKNDLATEQGREALRLEPNHPSARFALAFAYNASGMYAEAISTCETTLRSDPGNQDCLMNVGFAYAKSGRRREAKEVLRKFEDIGRKEYSVIYRPAVIHALLGDKDKAFAGLEKSFAAHDWDILLINVDPFVDSLRDDRRFKDLVKRMGFPQ
jgi:serine/threonine protein kinase/Flp pilus assembly protein TadD